MQATGVGLQWLIVQTSIGVCLGASRPPVEDSCTYSLRFNVCTGTGLSNWGESPIYGMIPTLVVKPMSKVMGR